MYRPGTSGRGGIGRVTRASRCSRDRSALGVAIADAIRLQRAVRTRRIDEWLAAAPAERRREVRGVARRVLCALRRVGRARHGGTGRQRAVDARRRRPQHGRPQPRATRRADRRTPVGVRDAERLRRDDRSPGARVGLLPCIRGSPTATHGRAAVGAKGAQRDAAAQRIRRPPAHHTPARGDPARRVHRAR